MVIGFSFFPYISKYNHLKLLNIQRNTDAEKLAEETRQVSHLRQRLSVVRRAVLRQRERTAAKRELVSGLVDELEIARRDLANLEAHLDEWRTYALAQRQALEKSADTIAEANAVARRAQMDLRQQNIRYAALERRLRGEHRALEDLDTALTALRVEHNHLNETLTLVRTDLDAAQLLDVTRCAEIAQLRTDLADSLSSAQDAQTAHAAERLQTEAERDAMRAEIAQLRTDLADSLSSAQDLQTAHAAERLQTEAERDAMRAEIAQLQTALADSLSRIESVETEATTVRCERDSMAQELMRFRRSREQGPVAKALKTSDRRYFVAFSLGRTATQWLVDSLNMHEDILATHAFDILPEKRTPASKGLAFLQSLQRQREVSERIANNADAAFDIMEPAGYRVIGNVHGLDALSIYLNPNAYSRKIHTSYITRHPILRLRSLVDRWQYEISLGEDRRTEFRAAFQNNLSSCEQILLADRVTFDEDDDWLFLNAVRYLLISEAPYLKTQIPIVLSERLTTDSDYLLWYFRDLTGDNVDFDPSLINQIVSKPAIDARNTTSSKAREMFLTWPAWKRRLFLSALEEAGTRTNYHELGYDTVF